MKWFFILLVITAGVLFLSNPDIHDFKQFIKEEARELLQEEVGASALGQTLTEGGAEIAASFVDKVTDQNNYFLFSTYEVELAPRFGAPKRWLFLGIGGQFINLDKFDPKQD